MLPLVIYVEDPDAPGGERRYVFKNSPVRLGRSPMNDLMLAQGFVSQLHGLVRFEAGSTVFVDLGSTNGTEIDGQRAARNAPVPVTERTRVAIGQIRLRIAREDVTPDVERIRVTQFHAVASKMPDEEEEGAGLGTAPTFIGKSSTASPAVAEDAPARGGASGPPQIMTMQEVASPDTSPRTLIASAADLAQGFRGAEAGVRKTPLPSGGTPTLDSLGQRYEEFRGAWRTLYGQLAQVVKSARPDSRAELIRQALKRMPALAQEPQFQQLAQENRVAVAAGSTADPAVRELLNQFVKSYVPSARSLDSKKELRAFLERLADVLEAFGNAFVELRRGHDQFGRQMAVPTAGEVTPLHRSTSSRDVLKYVLDWSQGADRVQELMGGFVDVMIHQIALLSGIQEGVRALLMKLSGEELERRVKDRQSSGLLAKLGLNKTDALWQAFVQRHAELLEDEQEMTKALFGPDFARAYVMIVGDRAKKANAEDEGGSTHATPVRGHARS